MRALEILVHDREKRPRADVLVEAHVGGVLQLRVTNELGIAQFAVPDTEMVTIVVDGSSSATPCSTFGQPAGLRSGHDAQAR
jgi:hypothetical protein